MGLFKSAEELKPLINFTWKRHKVLLSNIANADTPNYRRRDLVIKFEIPAVALKKTREKHITNLNPPEFKVVERKRGLIGNDKNNVSIEEEISELVKNRIAYEVYMRFATGSLSTLNKVIKGRAE